MSYPWFEHHQKAYENVTFPGTHLRQDRKEDSDTFMTLSEFVTANLENGAAVFIGGNVKHLADWRYNSDAFEEIPYGLSYRPIPDGTNKLMSELLQNASTYYKDMLESWHRVSEALPQLAPPKKFNEETWEWMTTRDYWIKLGKASIQMAYLATSVAPTRENTLSLARCARLGEIVLANENLNELSTSGLAHQILKNTGLCYVRLVKEKNELPEGFDLFAPLDDISKTHVHVHNHFDEDVGDEKSSLFVRARKLFEKESSWGAKASTRVLTLWGKFLSLPEAKSDASFATVQATVKALGGTA